MTNIYHSCCFTIEWILAYQSLPFYNMHKPSVTCILAIP